MTDNAQLGAASVSDGTSDFAAIEFICRQIQSEASTNALVRVTAVSGQRVNVLPLVNQVDGLGNATPHGVVNGLIWFQLQAGSSAIVISPVVGDIGLAVFCDRDISSVKASSAQANPGSARRFDMADGIYCGGIAGLNQAPTQFIEFLAGAAGINITTPGTLTLNAGGVPLSISSAGIMLDGRLWESHEHTGVTTGGSNTGPPA